MSTKTTLRAFRLLHNYDQIIQKNINSSRYATASYSKHNFYGNTACLNTLSNLNFPARKFACFTSPDMSAASTPTSAPTSPITGDYAIVPLKKEDSERAIEFLRRFFFRDEPLNVEQNLLETDDATCEELEEFSLKSIDEGVSLMATSMSGDIVGICLNGVLGRDDPEEEDFECPNKKFAKILKLLDFVDREANVFGQFPDAEKMMSLKILSVDGSWRGQGIAKALIDKSIDLCREQGCTFMRVDCTSHFSARAVARLGFECIYTLQYADYHGEDGSPVFVPEPPHSEVKVYVQRVV